jgi:hypothetical protein
MLLNFIAIVRSQRSLTLNIGLFALVLCVLALLCVDRASADDSSGPVCIKVHDAVSGRVITGARIFLIGLGRGESEVRISDANGRTCFETVRIAPFTLYVRMRGYRAFKTTIRTKPEISLSVDVALLDASPKTIVTVTSRSSVSSITERLVATSALSKVSPDLISALDHIPGIHIEPESGLGATASFYGADASTSSYEINGVSVGSGAALTINSDLLSSAETDASTDTLKLNFLSPTSTSEINAYASAGGYGASLLKGTLQGTTGQIGYVFAHSTRGQDSELNGQSYVDQSGILYHHVGSLNVIGNYGALSTQLGDWTLSAGDAVSSSIKLPILNYLSGPTPAGFGPGEIIATSAGNPVITANGTVGVLGASASFASWGLHSEDDYASRIVGKIPSPSVQFNSHAGADVFFRLESASSQGAISLSLDSRNQRYAFSANGPTGLDSFSRSQTVKTQDIQLAAHRNFAHSITITGEDDLDISEGRFSSELQGALKWSDGKGEAITANVQGGSKFIDDTTLANAYGVQNVAAAEYNCYNGTIVTNGPGASTATPTNAGLSLSIDKQFRRWSASVSLYDRMVQGTLISDAPVALSVLPQGTVPANVLHQLQAGYSDIGGCAGPTPQLTNILLLRNVAGVNVSYRGVSARTIVQVGNSLSIDGQVALTEASLESSVSLLTYALSPYIIGRQLPNVPLTQATLTFDWHGKHVEGLANLDYTSANNPRNLPAYLELNAGLLFQPSRRCTISVVGTNLGNAFVGYFISPRYAVPLMTLSSGGLPTLASPLNHSSILAQLHLALGQ